MPIDQSRRQGVPAGSGVCAVAKGAREGLGMAKQGKVLPARRQRHRSRDEDSILLRSAESLGRVIGSLQRQLDGATVRFSEAADQVIEYLPLRHDGDGDGARGATASGNGASSKRHKG